ncbi:beta-glucosidase BglX [Clostridium swellfunianum]|uniref:beta-glucosidase BglX n=1 Tax=Clostridium swellfunianum TaxID=1367462 RepID=UPI00202FB01E|nr:beta-glucosidase BglX [Clostridium swellfunianum]MCM0650231.1 beta-glucosidase BglX [Clostridium swellfunianum]
MNREKLIELLEDMSLEEKIDQLLQVCSYYYEKEGVLTGPDNTAGFSEEEIQNAGSVLGGGGAKLLRRIQENYMKKQPHHIPLLFMADVINGYRTIFPIPLAQGATFNPEIVEKAAAISAKESAASGLHLTFSPMVDLVRDARWGRVMESTGEDTFLNSCLSRAMVEGYQGKGELKEKGRIAACVKHFAGYGAPMAGRDYNTVELSERTLREDYLPAYKAGVDAGCATVMTSFNTLDRVPSTGNKKLMRDILRGEMGFDGVLISDWAAIEELIHHGMAADKKEAAALAMEAGVDIDMMTTCYCGNLKKLVEERKIDEALINEAVMRILELKNKLGLFENPYKDASEADEAEIILCKEHRETAKNAAIESMVLLKNDNILPLQKEGQSIAVIGPHAHNKWISGVWSIFAKIDENVTVQEGIKNLGIDNVTFAKGCGFIDPDSGIDTYHKNQNILEDNKAAEKLLEEAIENAKKAEVVVMPLGEIAIQSGEASSRASIDIPKVQMDLFEKIYEVNKNIVVVLFNGRPLTIKSISEKAKAVLEVWLPGTEGGNAIAEVLFGDANPSGKLSMSFPYSVGQVPVYYSEFHTGRPYSDEQKNVKYLSKYLDIPNAPLYPFGYGLSYTNFNISEVILNKREFSKGESIEASILIKNTGKVTGKEVVQMYIQDKKASVARPVRQLKGFQKVELQPGEERKVTFTITEEMLRFYDINMNFTSEKGEFVVYVGNDSRTQNKREFVLV